MKTIKAINQRALQLWGQTPPDIRGPRVPLMLSPVPESGIIFIGFNPSFAKRFEGTELEEALTYSIGKEVDTEKCASLDKKSFEDYPYFKKMKDISRKLNLHWSSLDLFFIRHPNQKYAASLVTTGIGFGLTDFGAAQFALFKAALIISKPKVVVMVNAQASHILKSELELTKDPEFGFYRSSLIDCPFHLGSMLSGQRAMDIYSVERLEWHIRQSLNRK